MSTPTRREGDGIRDVRRVEAFSDGVFAIAATLLFFQISLPRGDLLSGLAQLGPTFFSVGLSFLIIGVFWISHHRAFSHLVRVDDRMLVINLLLLLSIAFIPFASAVLSDRGNDRVAVIFYALCLFTASSLTAVSWLYATVGQRLVAADLSPMSSASIGGARRSLR